MIKFDEQLLYLTKGNTEQLLNESINKLIINTPTHQHFGSILPLNTLLVNKDKGRNLVLNLAKRHWGNVDLFLNVSLQDTSIDLENANERLNNFFSTPYGQKALWDYMSIHQSIDFNSLIFLVFGKEVKLSSTIGGLKKIYLYPVGKKYFIHTLFNDHRLFWELLFIKKVESLFLQVPLENIKNALELIRQYKYLLEQHTTLNQSVIMSNRLITELDHENVRSFQLKDLHIFNLISHYKGGKRHIRKLSSLINELTTSWGNGKWALSEKEHTLLAYIQATISAEQENYAKVIEYSNYLIFRDRLNNHAIELLLEYSDVLPNLKPEPSTFVKAYDKNYLEHIFYIVIDALIQMGQFNEVVQLLKQHEIASCTSIYHYLNESNLDPDALFKIEATIQQNLAYIVDNSPQYVLQSIELWLSHYQDKNHPWHSIATMTSKHLCNILKAFFATEHYELFEKLMEIYKKYLIIDDHFENLKGFVAVYVKS